MPKYLIISWVIFKDGTRVKDKVKIYTDIKQFHAYLNSPNAPNTVLEGFVLNGKWDPYVK